MKNRCECLFEAVRNLRFYSCDPLHQLYKRASERGLDEYGSVSSGHDNGLAYFYQCLVSLLHGGPRQGHSHHFVRESGSLAFSLRELEIELYTLTQPSGYAIRRNPRLVDTCRGMTLKLLETELTALCDSADSRYELSSLFR